MISVPCTVKCVEFWLNKKDKLGWIKYPAYADTKYDGEYCMADTTGGQAFLINGYGKARTQGPILNELPNDSIIFGELYCADGYNGDLYKLLSNKMGDDLKFGAFDVSRLSGRDVSQLPFDERRELLLNAINGKYAHVVDSRYVESETEALEAFDEVVSEGYEGVVIKQGNQALHFGPKCTWVKLKYTTMADLRVAAIDPSKERVECDLPNTTKRLGVKVMNKDKALLAVGDIIEVQHYGVLSGGGLRHPVYIRKRDANKKVSVDI